MLVPFFSMFEILLNFQAFIVSQAREEEEGDQSSAEEETEVWKDIPYMKKWSGDHVFLERSDDTKEKWAVAKEEPEFERLLAMKQRYLYTQSTWRENWF